MLKWKKVQDSLQAKYDSRFEVLERMDGCQATASSERQMGAS